MVSRLHNTGSRTRSKEAPAPPRAQLIRVLVLAAALLLPALAHAEPSAQEKETARALMDQGDERFDQKDFATALQSYQGAHAIMRVPTTAIEVAKAHEALGHLVEARDALLEAVRFPKAANEPAAFTTARVDAERHASELGARIPTITLKVQNAPKGTELHVSIDQVALPPAAALLPIKVNPGAHNLLVSSDVSYDVIKSIDVTTGQSLSIPIELSLKPESERPDNGKAGRRYRTIGIIGAGVGVVGLAIGTIFGLRASSQQTDAHCPSNVCKDAASADTLRSAESSATISTIAFIAGGALTAGGIALYLLSPSSSSSKDSESAAKSGKASLRVETRGLTGVALTGMF